ncbi:amino acid adenylation domain-containing protein [Kitasatospora sp. NPDC101801]|uniref:amino acid adenylation domain-containing protein n=1 Tax=Kitasatospora sp. NPDC101801 TaxID=3364103 RepID=UPI0038189A18
MNGSLSFGPSTAIPTAATAHHAVLAVAARTPDAPALRAGGRVVSYHELVERARAVQLTLSHLGLRPGSFVPVLARPGEAFTVAALGVLLAGGAYAALDPQWPAERVNGVVDDLAAAFVLDTTGAGLASAAVPVVALPGAALAHGGRPHGARPGAGAAPVADLAPVETGADAPACVFFTSGSTGRPKGVAVPHRAVLRSFLDGGYADLGPDTVMPLVAAPYWDAGALEIFGPLLNGGCAVEVPDGLLTPAGLRRLIREDGVNTLFLTSSLANLILDEDPGAFTGVRHLMVGGERVSPSHLATFLAEHPGVRLSNCYGPVESMVFATTHDVSAADLDAADGIPIGTAIRNTVLAVLDAEGGLAPVGQVGELLIGGDGLALGYVNRSEENAKRFDVLELPGREPLRVYRTGDLVRMTADGRLSYLARADRQFKVRGHRIEPGEVERVLGALDGVRECFLLPVRTAEGTVTGTVCAYTAEPGPALTAEELSRLSAAALPSYLRPDRFVRLDALPLGPTGKADLRAVEQLVGPVEPTGAPAPGPGPDGSPALRAVREILGVPWLGPDQDLLSFGANSLQMLRIAARLSVLLDTEFSARDVYRHSTVVALERLAARRPGRTASRPGRTDGQLSSGERRFWIAEQLAPGAPGHVAMSRIEVSGPIDAERLERALAAVAAAHPALRTTFPLDRSRPHRAVAAHPALPPLLRRPGSGESELISLTDELAAAVHDLANGPLLAAGLLTERADRHTLLIAVHHAVYDAHSEQVLLGDLAAAWDGAALPPAAGPPAAGPADDDADRAFWKAELAGLAPLALPVAAPDLRRLWTAPVTGQPIALPAGTAGLLRAAAVRHRTPALTLLLASWWRALSGWTGQLDLAIGTVVADRAPADERTIGYLANGLPIRVPGHPGASGPELLALVGDRLLAAFAHAALPTDRIAALAPRPPAGRSPLYQTMLVLQRVGAPVRLGAATLRPRPAPPLGPQTELCCELWEDGDELTGALHVPLGLLPPDTLALLTGLFASELNLLLTKDPT